MMSLSSLVKASEYHSATDGGSQLINPAFITSADTAIISELNIKRAVASATALLIFLNVTRHANLRYR